MEHTVKERLIEFMKYKGLSQAKFEKSVGLSNGYINQLRHAPCDVGSEDKMRIGCVTAMFGVVVSKIEIGERKKVGVFSMK